MTHAGIIIVIIIVIMWSWSSWSSSSHRSAEAITPGVCTWYLLRAISQQHP
jgi:hypothetical protein